MLSPREKLFGINLEDPEKTSKKHPNMSPNQLQSIQIFKVAYSKVILDYAGNPPDNSKVIKAKKLLSIFSIIIGIDFEDLWADLAPKR